MSLNDFVIYWMRSFSAFYIPQKCLYFREYTLSRFLLFWRRFVIYCRYFVIHLNQTGISHHTWIPIFVTVLSALVNHEHRNWTPLFCVTRTENFLNWTPTYALVTHQQDVGNKSTWYSIVLQHLQLKLACAKVDSTWTLCVVCVWVNNKSLNSINSGKCKYHSL
jgi:hypothetical protein